MIRVFEAFAGYGSQSIALRNLGIEHEVVAISEIDKYALKAYYALHDESIPNLGDISKIKIEDVPEHDLFTYSFPCQDISTAGKQKGIIKGKTRSGLLYECERIIEGRRPKYLLLENVKNLVGKKHKPQFDKWLEYLETLGYTNYWQVLNAKDYGIPQNRERVFVVSILNDMQGYQFQSKIELTKKMQDMFEEKIEEKYYLTTQCLKTFTKRDTGKYPRRERFLQNILKRSEIANTITTRAGSRPEDNFIIEKEGINIENYSDFKIRKLTPRECFRLMGLKDNDIDKIQATGISDTQQYKMAGNSIVVNVLEVIFKNLF